jgi:hypothetical protein
MKKCAAVPVEWWGMAKGVAGVVIGVEDEEMYEVFFRKSTSDNNGDGLGGRVAYG